MSNTYVVCGTRTWNRKAFDERISKLPGSWHFVDTQEALTPDALRAIAPRYVFFLHWSWIVPAAIIDQCECINFHMTDLPFGRGGSPLQNLILLGRTETKLSAFKMTDELDAGPVYGKEDLSLAGTAEDILRRSTDIATKMIEKIIKDEPTPVAQKGTVTLFSRRKPEQSEIPPGLSQAQLYDYIRMLDGEGYPPAFIRLGKNRITFHNATLDDDVVKAEVTVEPF